MEKSQMISIPIPTYNRVTYLKECLASIICQKRMSKEELEIIMSDNSEWDETKEFMLEYTKKHDNRTILYNKNKENMGMVRNRNKLLEIKKWKYSIFLSDDENFYDENSIRNLYNWINTYKLDAYHWIREFVDSKWQRIDMPTDYMEFNDIKFSDNVYLKKNKKEIWKHSNRIHDDQLSWKVRGFELHFNTQIRLAKKHKIINLYFLKQKNIFQNFNHIFFKNYYFF